MRTFGAQGEGGVGRRRALAMVGGLGLGALVALTPAAGAQANPPRAGGALAATVGRELAGVPTGDMLKAMREVPAPKLSLPKAVKGRLLTSGGKPEVLYIGADWCPFCATERWPLVVALSRFGTWSHLGLTSSSSSDIFPGTASLSFYGARFSSKYITFSGVETASNKRGAGGVYVPLAKPSPSEQKTFAAYDAQGSIPFVDFGNRFVLVGASYNPQILSGLSASQIGARLKSTGNAVAVAIDATAGYLALDICKLDRGQPGGFCRALSRASGGK